MRPKDVQVLILAGGFGTRLKSVVNDLPKPMAPIAGKPFLEHLIQFLSHQGFKKIGLLTGHMAKAVSDFFGDGSRFGVEISYSAEETPLGTGGAIAKAMIVWPADHYLVLNGDSFFCIDYAAFVKSAESPITMALKKEQDVGRYGGVEIDQKKRVRNFREKSQDAGAGLINAGVYYFSNEVQKYFEKPVFSIEKDLFETSAESGLIKAIVCEGSFIDIGIPDSLRDAQDKIPKWIKQYESK